MHYLNFGMDLHKKALTVGWFLVLRGSEVWTQKQYPEVTCGGRGRQRMRLGVVEIRVGFLARDMLQGSEVREALNNWARFSTCFPSTVRLCDVKA